jgi:hypothetical protein
MTTIYSTDLPCRPIRCGDEYAHERFQGQTMYLPVENVRDAAMAFATRYARQTLGKSAYCHHVRADSWQQDGRAHYFEAFIGKSADSGGTVGRNIWLTVFPKDDSHAED